ncbi:hypothetical protein M407DRAFT_240427 [Tulasnella calospora MUT 4182]|uniref:Uncharacterized protein n=1 Tax=Tulasnella calospora MUT 4182 TaxID=1051891 RepID=A0A0C3QX07_9AGAM|nr:hypothetical protein M407DRAFT_240427 [Tulasnella calospora MUT 4182]
MASPYPHYAWATGHFILLLCSMRYLLAWVTFKSSAYEIWYRSAFTGAIVSYAIVVYKSLGTPQPNAAYFRKALADENFQYFLLALFWWFTKPVSLALIPYATFSLFHALTFTRTNIIPRVFPTQPVPGQGEAARAPAHPLAKSIHTWVKANYDGAMRSVAWTELVILVRVSLGCLFGIIPFVKFGMKNSFLAPIVFAQFLRLRYYYSAFTRTVVQNADGLITNYVDQPSAPPALKQAWGPVRAAITKYGASVIEPAQPAAGAAGARR